MRTHGSAEELTSRHQRAVALARKGLSSQTIAVQLGVSTRSVDRWKEAYRKGGSEALEAKPVPGRPHKLTVQQRKGLIKRLLSGARAQGFSTDLWTCPRIAQLIKTCYGVCYHIDYIPTLMKSLGFSCQKPERRASERDEKVIAAWVRKDWPRIKKKLVG